MIEIFFSNSFRKIEMAKQAENKTQPNSNSVIDFLNAVESEQKCADAFTVLDLMRSCTGFEPVMWGESIVGFGIHKYEYKSGREGINACHLFFTAQARFDALSESLRIRKRTCFC
jgi:hypothetical protein